MSTKTARRTTTTTTTQLDSASTTTTPPLSLSSVPLSLSTTTGITAPSSAETTRRTTTTTPQSQSQSSSLSSSSSPTVTTATTAPPSPLSPAREPVTSATTTSSRRCQRRKTKLKQQYDDRCERQHQFRHQLSLSPTSPSPLIIIDKSKCGRDKIAHTFIYELEAAEDSEAMIKCAIQFLLKTAENSESKSVSNQYNILIKVALPQKLNEKTKPRYCREYIRKRGKEMHNVLCTAIPDVDIRKQVLSSI